jgi:ribosomal protein L7/L12
MDIVITVIIVLIGIGMFYILNAMEMDDQITKNNSNEVDKKLKDKDFKTSKIFSIHGNEQQFRVDLEHKQIAICSIFPYQKIDIINFSDIIECQIIEDSNTVMKGGVGRAVVGGALAGGVGAIVGANTRASKNVINILQIRIITKKISNSLYTIDLIKTEIEKNSMEYRNAMNFANNVYAILTSIITNNDKVSNNLGGKKTMEQNNNNFIEQLERLSKLRNDGMITEKEFEESKQKILNSQNESLENKVEIEQDEFDLRNDIYNIEQKIQLYGNDKIRIIKALREETGFGLVEANNIVDEYFKNR